MIQLEKLKYVPLNSFFAFDKENYFTNLVNLGILKRNIKSTIISIPVYQSSEIRIFDKNMPLSCTS